MQAKEESWLAITTTAVYFNMYTIQYMDLHSVYYMLVFTKDFLGNSTIAYSHERFSEGSSGCLFPLLPPPHLQHLHCSSLDVQRVLVSDVLESGEQEAEFDAQSLPVPRDVAGYCQQLTLRECQLCWRRSWNRQIVIQYIIRV